ncbi:MAG TPA: holo-[acyl-carrier-protein] synthase [Holosporales bacterium]|nr:holo-[acyl-carrier-protein] synthase [Holosporales bacterium]
MIIGIGIDLIDSRRLEKLIHKFGDQFLQRIFTENERIYAEQSPYPLRVYSNRFAAKEAAVKALGTGMREGISWQNIETLRSPLGAPQLCFHGKAWERLSSCVPSGHKESLHVSFSDEPPYSTAFVVIEVKKEA